ncbi:hypothetical protein EV655_113114, partial [Rhodovulum euryhalinum]
AETLQGLVTRFRLRQARTTAPMAALRLVGPEAEPDAPAMFRPGRRVVGADDWREF